MSGNPTATSRVRIGPLAYAAPSLGVGGEVAVSALAGCLRVPLTPATLPTRAGGVDLCFTTTGAGGKSFRLYRLVNLEGGRKELDLIGTVTGTVGSNAGSADSTVLPTGFSTVDGLAFTEVTEASSPAGRGLTFREVYGGREAKVSNGTGLRSYLFLPDCSNADELVIEPQSGAANELFAVIARVGH